MSLKISPFNSVTRLRNSISTNLKYANNCRKQGLFNDVTIQSADTSIPANRMVLSSFCLYFDEYFATETNNQVNTCNSIVDIPDVEGKLLELLIQYIYSGRICIDSDNVFDILSAAHRLELNEVKEFCFEFLENCMTLDNCITILITAKQYDENCTLRDKVYKLISDNYNAITQKPAFLNLDNQELFFIVYHLKTKFYINDEVLCQSLLSWTKQDEETRKQHFHNRLFKFVNVDKLSYCFVKDLLNESLICNVSEYLDLLNTRIKLIKSRETKILTVGGFPPKTSVKIVFSLDDETNVVYPALPIPVYYHSTLKVNNFVYCIGGTTLNSVQSNKVFRLNLNDVDMKWNEMAEMKNKRGVYGAAVFNHALVVCGGIGETTIPPSEAYDAQLNKWNQISSLKQNRYGNQSVTSGGYLYTMGGYNTRNYLSSVERLDGLDQSWKSVAPMQTPRLCFASVSCDDVIYAIGGSDGSKGLKSVEKYNCTADKWIYVSEMNIKRQCHAACVVQGKIFVVGGENGEEGQVKEIECYDPSSDRWEIVTRIDNELGCHSLVAV